MQRLHREGEADAVDQTLGDRVGSLHERGQAAEDLGVEVVDGAPGEQGDGDVVGRHDTLQEGSAARAARSLARQRPRVGPMLPTGIPSAWETTA